MNLTRTRPYAFILLPVGILCWIGALFVFLSAPGSPSSREEIINDFVSDEKLPPKEPASDLPPKAERAQHRKIVLFWTSFFGDRNSYLGEEGDRLKICPVSECLLTDDRSLWNSADALIFHPLDFNLADVPPQRHAWQYYIYFVLESPHHSSTGPAGFFNLTFTYRLDSDIIADNYLQYFRPAQWHTEQQFLDVWKRKTRGVAMFASNCGPPSDRQNYVKILQKYIPVDVYGACGQATHTCTRDTKDKCDRLVGEYKFYLAFENSICKDYISEKAIRPYAADTIPIFLGGANYSAVFPADSFIDVQDYPSPKELAAHLLRVSGNREAYAAYFKFRFRPPTNPHNSLPPYLAPENVSLCKLCRILHAKKLLQSVHTKLETWWVAGGNCKTPSWNENFKELL